MAWLMVDSIAPAPVWLVMELSKVGSIMNPAWAGMPAAEAISYAGRIVRTFTMPPPIADVVLF